MPAQPKPLVITTPSRSDQRETQIQLNASILGQARLGLSETTDNVRSWLSAVTASLGPLGRGSTDTAVGTGQVRFYIAGQAATEIKAAVAAGTALATGTIAINTWGVYAYDIATGGTINSTAGAGNTTGVYTTEALAWAARPVRVSGKARLGYVTVKTAIGTTFVAGTDGLFGGSSGNVASATNYYPHYGIDAPTGVSSTALVNVEGQSPAIATATPWSGGFSGVLIGSAFSLGSTDTRFATTAFTFNAGGICNLAKAAVAAGTAFGALGTIPINQWGIVVACINAAGAVSFLSGPDNYGNGYPNEQQAIGALNSIFPAAGLCVFGYVTVRTKTGTTFIFGTDSLLGGATGNVASATNYYPTASVGFGDSASPTTPIPTGALSAAQIATNNNVVLTSAQN